MQRVWRMMGVRPGAPKITAQDRAILDLKLQRDRVRQYQKQIQFVLNREHEIAKQCLAKGQKDRALLAGQLEQLEQLVSAVEFAQVEVAVLHGLKQGNAVLAEIHRNMNIENVEKLMEETHEAIAYQNEISEMLASTMSVDEEEAVQQELLALQVEVGGIQLPPAPISDPVSPLPDVPTREPVHEEEEGQRTRVALPA